MLYLIRSAWRGERGVSGAPKDEGEKLREGVRRGELALLRGQEGAEGPSLDEKLEERLAPTPPRKEAHAAYCTLAGTCPPRGPLLLA